MRLRLAPVTMLLAALPIAAPDAVRAQSRWLLEACAFGATPVAPDLFNDGWGLGLGLGGSLRRQLGTRVQIGLDADFAQFKFEGLEGFAPLGGERRFVRVGVPLRLRAWERRSPGRERLSLQASVGWAHQAIEGTFGSDGFSPDRSADGVAITGGVRVSRRLYRRTRWSVGVRYTRHEFPDESPQYVGLIVGVRMPLDGAR